MYNIYKEIIVSIYKSTLNRGNSKPKKSSKKEPRKDFGKTENKIKTKPPKVISKLKVALILSLLLISACFIFLCFPNGIRNMLLGVFGLSAYPICLLSAFLCLIALGKNKYEVNKKYTIFLSFALFFVVMIIHLVLTTKIATNSFGDYIKDTYKLKTSGAGIIMSCLTYFMKKYLTGVGAYIFASILLTIFVGLILDNKQVKKLQKTELQQPKKSEFDFSGLISEEKVEEVPITLQFKQEDLKKKIAKQKLGLENGSSTIISSSMRLSDIEEYPPKYKSKREYILTPPEISIPSYDKTKSTKSEQDLRAERELINSSSLNKDIFVSDTDDFYKDAKVIESSRQVDLDFNNLQQDNKINTSYVSPSATNSFNTFNENHYTDFDDYSETDSYENDEIINSNSSKGLDIFSQLDTDDSYDQNNENETSNQESLNYDKYNQYSQYSNSQNNEYDNYNNEKVDYQQGRSNDYINTSNVNTEFKFAKTNTNEEVRNSSIQTSNNTFTRSIEEPEEKVEQNPLGRPKKYHPEYVKPPVELLKYLDHVDVVTDEECNENIEKLETVLQDFKINAKVKAVQVGPAVTRYEIGMPQGVSVKKVQFHADDIAMALASNGSIRIEAPIPGKNAVGIEVPNRNVTSVSLREMIESLDFQKRVNPMSFVLGKDINGSIQFCNLDKMPHLLVAGSTGSGKSVCLNTMLISMLYKSSPEDVRLILIDPKTVEFSTYANLPHLLTPEIITTKEQTINALNWAIKEMEYRYTLLQKNHVVNIKEYNNLDIVKNNEVEKLPYIVIVVDELGDLMIDAKREMEERIMKLAQKSRAAGIHLVLATQRPSVDVVTGTIKANLPSRIAFALTNFADSKTVLDMSGAEKLLGKGDMLFKPSDLPEPRRVQGAFISSKEINEVVKFIKDNNKPDYDEDVGREINQTAETTTANLDNDSANFDPVLKDALRFFIQANQASITMIQRRFGVGYARAARIIDQMEQNGFISQQDGSKPRQVLISLEEYNLLFNK